jgi:glycosyltransferase involved in cell wall biosynthesis
MKKSIVILSTSTGYGGGERSLETLLPMLANDYEVYFLGQNSRHLARCRNMARCDGSFHMSSLPTGPRLVQLAYGIVWLLKVWAIRRPHFILANSNKSAMVAAFAAIMKRDIARRTILYVRDFEWKQRGFIFGTMQRSLFLVPTKALLDPPSYLAPWVSPHGGARCEIVMNAVEFRQHIGVQLGTETPYIVLPATVQEWKGHEYVVRALGALPRSLRAIFLGDVQDVAYHRKVVKLAESLGVADRVLFQGYHANVSAAIAGSVCVIISSVDYAGGPESFGRGVIEAWAAGRPVVAFAVGGPRYLIEDRRNGLLVSPRDPEALAQAVNELLLNPELAANLGRAGHEKARARFSPHAIYSDFRTAVDSFLEPSG